MAVATMTLTDFLLARIAEDEEAAGWVDRSRWQSRLPSGDMYPHLSRHHPARVLAECEAKRRIVEFHRSWPVMVETPPTFERSFSDADLNSVTLRASQQIQWLTEQEYRAKFGDEPPTAPMLAALAAVYADHPDYRDEWKP